MIRLVTFVSALLVPFSAIAASTYDARHLDYSDIDPSDIAAVSISTLTKLGVLEGNPDGTFQPNRLLNRAEFLKIAIPLYTGPLRVRLSDDSCFPDVPKDAWYRPSVCTAKALGIVRGNVIPGKSSIHWPFEPERPVQYEEAVKILTEVFGYQVSDAIDEEWYEPYLDLVEEFGLGIDLQPGMQMERDEMAMLASRYYAFDRDELDVFLTAEAQEVTTAEEVSSSSTTSSFSSFRSSSFSSFVSSSSKSSVASAIYDTDSDVSQSSTFLLLGRTSPVMASMKIMSDSEPLALTAINITLTQEANSIASFLVYDHDARFVGRAFLDTSVTGNATYRLSTKTKGIEIPRSEDLSFYIRADMKEHDAGGISSEVITVQSMGMEADGIWSNKQYSSATTEAFSSFETSRAMFTSITRDDDERGLLIGGSDVLVGAYTFTGELADSQADLRMTDLQFTVGSIGSVTIENVVLQSEGSDIRHACSVGASVVTCADLPETVGSVEDAPRTLKLYADVTVPTDAKNAALQLSLNQPGDVLSSGAVTWTDGTEEFEWVSVGAPIVRGTYYEQ